MDAGKHAGHDFRQFRQGHAHLGNVGRRISRRQNLDGGRLDPLAEFGKLDAGRRHTAHRRQTILRHAGGDTQAARLVDGEQRRPRHGHVTGFGVTPGDDAGHRRDDGGVALAGTGGTAIGGSRVEIGLRLVERSLADELLRLQLLVPFVIEFRHVVLGVGSPGGFARLARIDAHQEVALVHPLAGIGAHFQHPASDLGADRRLLHGLDHGFGRESQVDRMQFDGDDRQGIGRQYCGRQQIQGKNQASGRLIFMNIRIR
jgi:hypothetical protein